MKVERRHGVRWDLIVDRIGSAFEAFAKIHSSEKLSEVKCEFFLV